MSKDTEDFLEKMQELLPSTKEEYQKSVVEYGEVLITVVIEDIFMPQIQILLAKDDDKKLLWDIFIYLEEIVNKGDQYLINILFITVLEILGNDRAILDIAKKYMGPKTALLQMETDRGLGRV